MIELTEQDADFIANIMRKKLELADENFRILMDKFRSITAAADKYLEHGDVEDKDRKEYDKLKGEAFTKLKSGYENEKKELTRILELMMSGSEKMAVPDME